MIHTKKQTKKYDFEIYGYPDDGSERKVNDTDYITNTIGKTPAVLSALIALYGEETIVEHYCEIRTFFEYTFASDERFKKVVIPYYWVVFPFWLNDEERVDGERVWFMVEEIAGPLMNEVKWEPDTVINCSHQAMLFDTAFLNAIQHESAPEEFKKAVVTYHNTLLKRCQIQ